MMTRLDLDFRLPPRLPLSFKPIAGESINGLFVRLAEAMGYDSAAWIADMGDFQLPSSFVSEDDIKAISQMTGIDEGVLRKMTPSEPVQRRYEFLNTLFGRPMGPRGDLLTTVLGQTIDAHAVSPSPRRACPKCLAASPHHRLLWDLQIVRICAEHGCALISSCPACGKGLSWTFPSLTRCRCGFDLAVIDVDSWPKAMTGAAQYVQGILTGSAFPNALLLDGCDLYTALILIDMFGCTAMGERPSLHYASPDIDAEILMAAGFTVLAGDVASVQRWMLGQLSADLSVRKIGAIVKASTLLDNLPKEVAPDLRRVVTGVVEFFRRCAATETARDTQFSQTAEA